MHINSTKTQKMVHYDANFDHDSILLSVSHPQCDPAKGQVQFYRNLISNFSKKEKVHAHRNFPK